ncbi:MAG: hypothetical protein GY760_23225 [Deltaproteobacteria bacterium]|nr:hypothetical protein [Deltaproteobacteria bacterium]
MDALIEDVKLFESTGKLNKYNMRLINTCSWTNYDCVLSKLTRFKIDKDLNIKPCLNNEQSIGKLTDDYFENIKSASKVISKARIKRNCNECSAKKYCSKCSFLPEGISEELFCESLRKYPSLPEFLFKFVLLSDISETSVTLKDSAFEDLEISNQRRPLVFDCIKSENNYMENNILTAFKLGEDFYAISYRNPKIIKTDERFIYIAEGYVRNIETENLIDLYCQKYSFKTDEATSHVQEAYKVMKEAKIV